ncbi:MAG: lysophospholipid acyltransferase family protein [Mariprofundaceae bacterium]|nr:lysophospholipid acyltransferase family protein [Mariprofundaceae bacterium]
MMYIRSILFYVLFILSTALVTSAVTFSRLFGQAAAWKMGQIWGLNSNLLLRYICGIRIKIEGQEHIPTQACVVVAKHQSTWETTTLPLYLPPFVWVLKQELMYIPLFGWALKALDAIAIQRSNPREALKKINNEGIKELQNGRSVLIFPEGTRTAVGETGNYQPSAIMLAKKAEVPILLVAHNAGVCWPRGSILKQSGTITLRFLPPISAQEVQEGKRNDLLATCETRIEAACRELGG